MKRSGIRSSSGIVEDRTILTAVTVNRTGADPRVILGEAPAGLRPASAPPKITTCDVAHFHEQCRWTGKRRGGDHGLDMAQQLGITAGAPWAAPLWWARRIGGPGTGGRTTMTVIPGLAVLDSPLTAPHPRLGPLIFPILGGPMRGCGAVSGGVTSVIPWYESLPGARPGSCRRGTRPRRRVEIDCRLAHVFDLRRAKGRPPSSLSIFSYSNSLSIVISPTLARRAARSRHHGRRARAPRARFPRPSGPCHARPSAR